MPLKLCANAVGVTPFGMSLHRRKHPRFEEALQRAIAEGVKRHLTKIEQAAKDGDWKASAWALEHCHAEYFCKNRIEVTGADGSPLAGAIALYLPQKQDSNGAQLPAVSVPPLLAERNHGDGNGG